MKKEAAKGEERGCKLSGKEEERGCKLAKRAANKGTWFGENYVA